LSINAGSGSVINQSGSTTLNFFIFYFFAGLALVALCSMVGGAVGVAVMSVDIGSEWMKVAVVSVSIINVNIQFDADDPYGKIDS
jgi:hypothetical protein